MKGIVFNLLEDAVTESHGSGTWDDLLDETGVDGAYTALGNYEDAELVALVGGVCRHRGAAPDDVLRASAGAPCPAWRSASPSSSPRTPP